jgi:hypothetical protein
LANFSTRKPTQPAGMNIIGPQGGPGTWRQQ